MNKFYLQCAFTALLSCLFFSIGAQNASLCRQVLSTAGESTKRQNIHYDYTIGEPFIFTFQSNPAATTLTQGFQQPDECSAVVLQNELTASFSVLIFPNPTLDYLHIQYEGAERLSSVHVSIVDAAGKIHSNLINSTLDFSELDCTALSAGSYFLLFKNESGKELGSHTFVKL